MPKKKRKAGQTSKRKGGYRKPLLIKHGQLERMALSRIPC